MTATSLSERNVGLVLALVGGELPQYATCPALSEAIRRSTSSQFSRMISTLIRLPSREVIE